MLAKSLSKLGAAKELVSLKAAEGALAAVSQLIMAKGGVVDKIRNRIDMQQKSVAGTGKLRQIVLKQAETGCRSVTVAQGDQEKSIIKVNGMVKFNISLIIEITTGPPYSAVSSGSGYIVQFRDR